MSHTRGCLGTWSVCVGGVFDTGSPAVGCPVIHQPHRGSSLAGYPREWKILTTQVLIQGIEHPERRHSRWIFTGSQSGWLQGKVCSWAGCNKKRSQHRGSDNKETTLQFVAEPRVSEAHVVAFEVQTSTKPPITQLILGTAPALYVTSSTEGFLDPELSPAGHWCR